MPRLVAVEASGEQFVERMLRVWDAGDAVAPIDPRLPPPARAALEHTLGAGEDVEPGDALVIATSGSTGEPKGVVLTHDALAASAATTSARVDVDPAADCWLACLPLAHIGGLAVVVRAVLTGTRLIVHDRFDPEAVRDAASAGATLVSLVPTMLRRVDPQPYRRILLGGAAPLGPLAFNVIPTYGLTETGSGVVYGGDPLDGVAVRVSDGEVFVRGPMLLRCYRDGHDPKDAEGWLATGDAGALDATGRLSVTGRMGDVINTGGEKVWPAAVEAVIDGAPGVAQVAVAGRADSEWGQRVVAFIVPVDPAAPPTLDAIRTRVRDALPAYAAPRELALVSSLPRTASGKIRRADLA